MYECQSNLPWRGFVGVIAMLKTQKQQQGVSIKKIVIQTLSVHKVKASHESCKNQKERRLSYFELFNALIF